MHRAVKWTLVTSVLAASSAGTYHFTPAGAWIAKLIRHDGPDAQLVAEETPAPTPTPSGAALSKSDLDAVASAWADAAPSKSAEATADHAAEPTVVRDEQVTPAEYVAAADGGTSKQLKSDDAAKEDKATDIKAVAISSATASDDDRYTAHDSKEPTLAPLDLSSATRGQAPEDAKSFDTTATNQNAPIPSAGNSDPARAASSQRARDAFRNTHAAAAAPNATSAADDRYDGAPLGNGREHVVTSNERALSNPFGPQPATPATHSEMASQLPPTGAASAPVASPMPLGVEGGGHTIANIDAARPQPEPIQPASPGFNPSALDSAAPRRAPLTGGADAPYNRGPSSYSSASPGSDGTGRPGERALEGPQKPSLVIQKFAPPEIQVGKPAKFTVQVKNIGGQTAAEVVIRDEVPQGTKLVSTTPKADVDGSHLSWQIGSLSTGEEKTVQVELMPTAEGDIGSVAGVSYAAQASAKTHCTMPQLAIRMTAPSQVMIGQDEHVKIELRNPGTGDATGVMLLENVPENVKHVAGPALEFEVGTLHASETREMDLVLTAQKAGKVINALTARADGNLQVQQQVEFEVIAPALQVSVDGPEKRYLERPATYQVSVQNPGTAPAHDIELVTKLPKGMKFVRANNMGQYDASTHAVYWSLAELPEGEKGTVELVAMPVEAGQQTLEVQGKAQQGLSDQTKRDVVVEGISAIMFEVKDTEDPIEVNGETTYEIRIVNQGSKAATNVQVGVSLPPGLQFISASGETHFSAERGGIVFAPLKQLAPKADTVYRVQVKGVQPGDQRVAVQVSTDDITQPIRREESTRVFGDQ
jgi:uncharacterized repeat protein (TIGR01451 family)